MAAHFSERLAWPVRANALSSLRDELRLEGRDILDLSESNPTRALPRAAPEKEADGILGPLSDPANLLYAPDPRGLPAAREALAERYANRASRAERRAEPEEFFLCASTSEAYAWLFKLLCDPGDAILVPRPGYPLFDYLAGLEAAEARPYRLEYSHPSGWRIDLDSVRRALRGEAGGSGRARAIVVINPNNPTGSYVGESERGELVGLCERHGCALIADEVFFDFRIEAERPSSFAGEEGCLTFALDGLSKLLGLPQLKLGWIAASGPALELAEALGRLEIIADSYLSAGTPPMRALGALLGRAGEFAASTCSRLSANLSALRGILGRPGSPHRVLRCEGGWTALVESPRLAGEEELAAGLLREAGIWAQPGYFFDMEREGCFAMSLILPPELLAEGARRYYRYFETLMEAPGPMLRV